MKTHPHNLTPDALIVAMAKEMVDKVGKPFEIKRSLRNIKDAKSGWFVSARNITWKESRKRYVENFISRHFPFQEDAIKLEAVLMTMR